MAEVGFARRELDLSDIRFFVLDEADEMLNMGFQEDVETVLESVPAQRQTMMFSATMPQWVRKLAKKYAQNHIMVDLVGEHDTGMPLSLFSSSCRHLHAVYSEVNLQPCAVRF